MNNESTFLRLRNAARYRDDLAEAYRRELDKQYGASYLAPFGKQTRLKHLDDLATEANDAFFSWLRQYGGRDWQSGVPWRYVVDSLTYADATTRGQLAVIPPPAYGMVPADMIRFSWPVEGERRAS